MKKKILGVMIVIVVVSLVLAACGGGTDDAANGGTGDAPAAGGSDMDAVILEKLEDHHGTDEIYNVTRTREEWEVIMDRMINTYGAKINEEEKQAIIDYLVSR